MGDIEDTIREGLEGERQRTVLPKPCLESEPKSGRGLGDVRWTGILSQAGDSPRLQFTDRLALPVTPAQSPGPFPDPPPAATRFRASPAIGG